MSTYGALSKLKGLLAIRKFQKHLYANLRILNDYGLIMPIKTNEKAYMRVYFIFKIGDVTSMRIYFLISVLHMAYRQN